MIKMHRTPPFVTPFAILSLIIILGASNVFENKVTHTNEGAPVRQTRVVNNNHQMIKIIIIISRG
ncbi:MAG: hypothetical protein AJITA_00214 [Acetilactobacillus jinshanensis]